MSLGLAVNRANIKQSAITAWHIRSVSETPYTFTTDKNSDPAHLVVGNPFVNTDTVYVYPGVGGVLPTGLTAGTAYYIVGAVGDEFSLSLTSGGAAVSVSSNGTSPCYISFADAAYYPLKHISEGKLSAKTLSVNDSKGRGRPYGLELTASCKMLATGKASVLKVLDTIASSGILHVITTPSGTFSSAGLTSSNKFGTKFKFVCDADSDKNRYIEISASRKIAKSEMTELLTTAAPSYGSPAATDNLYPLNSISNTDIIPAGFLKYEICDTYNGDFLDIGEIRNGKLTVELLTVKNSIGCDVGYALKVDVSVEAMQASATELSLLEGIAGANTFHKITLLDGTVFTLASSSDPEIGIDIEFAEEYDSEGIAFVRYSGSGVVLASQLDTIFV